MEEERNFIILERIFAARGILPGAGKKAGDKCIYQSEFYQGEF
jgi:hypothetical protein